MFSHETIIAADVTGEITVTRILFIVKWRKQKRKRRFVGDAGRGEELALVPRSALIESNMARLSVSAKIFTTDACVVQMMLATMILCTVTTKNNIYYTLQTSGCGDQEVEMVVHHVTSVTIQSMRL